MLGAYVRRDDQVSERKEKDVGEEIPEVGNLEHYSWYLGTLRVYQYLLGSGRSSLVRV